MGDIDQRNVKTRGQADDILKEIEPELSVRQFLLTNLVHDGGAMRFRIPVQILMRGLDSIGDFPFAPPTSGGDGSERAQQTYEGPTLFVKGERSKCVESGDVTDTGT